MSARSAQALIGAVPQRIFGYFLCEQKVTPFPLGSQRPPYPFSPSNT